MEEIWKDIDGFEGYYQISNLGNVKSLDRILKDNGGIFIKRGNYRKLAEQAGYKRVSLYKNDKDRKFMVHRLVAQAFIPNPNNKPFIDHIDGNRANNKVDNLRWVTHSENMKNPITVLRKSEAGKRLGDVRRQCAVGKCRIKCIETNVIYESMGDCNRITGINRYHIGEVCNGTRKTAGGFHWRYA